MAFQFKSKTDKYLRLHLRLKIKMEISRKTEGASKRRQIYWNVDWNSEVLESKLLIYKSIFKSIWTYGIQVYGYTPKHVSALQIHLNEIIYKDLNIKWIEEVEYLSLNSEIIELIPKT